MSLKKDKFNQKDKSFMNLALDLASERLGLTGSNPSVGCVIVNNQNQILSIGQTGFNGRPHAEYSAITNAKQNLKDAKMYVTLEPCNHYGKTSPCTNLIIKKKIKEVIFSINDIDIRTRNKTLKILKSKNINVKKGLLIKRINKLYESYFFNRLKKIPYVTGKIAISKNNLIFQKNNKRITNTYSEKVTHLLRFKNDSILISYKTLNKDNPKLNCRINGLNNFSPNRIIIDQNLKTKTNSYIFNTVKNKNTIIFYNYATKKKINLFKKKGINLIKLKLNQNNKFDLNIILRKLYFLGCRNLLVEGGKDLSINFFKRNLFNQFYMFKSPFKILKVGNYREFNPTVYLSKNFKFKSKINTYLDKDMLYLYKN